MLCPTILIFNNLNPSQNQEEIADDIIHTSESLDGDKIYKAGFNNIIEYIELQIGFNTNAFNFEAINEQCDPND